MNPIKDAVRSALAEALSKAEARDQEMPLRDIALSLLERAITNAKIIHQRIISAVGTTTGDSQHFALLLYFTILSLSDSAYILGKQTRSIAIATIARQALDACIDLINLLKHPNYYKSLELNDCMTWKKVLEETYQGKNPFLRPLTENLNANCRFLKERITTLDKEKVKTIGAEERFKMADEPYSYTALYTLLRLAPITTLRFCIRVTTLSRTGHLRCNPRRHCLRCLASCS